MTYFGEFKASWHVLLVSALGLALGSAFNHYASNLFNPALLREFGWQKSDLALTGALSLVSMFVVPLWGRFTDSFGPRIAASIGFVAVALSYFAYSRMTGSLTEYVVITAVHNIFGILTTTIVFGRVIVERFNAARGMALSIMMTGAPLAAALLTPILAVIIKTDGWRMGYIYMMIFALVTGVLAVMFVGGKKSEKKGQRFGFKATMGKFLQLCREPAFLLLVGGMVLLNIPQNLVGGQLVIMLQDNSAKEWILAAAISIYSSSVIVGRFLTGLALDRIPSHFVAIFALGLPAVGYFALATPYNPTWLLVGAVMLVGLAQGAEGDLGAYIAARKFGTDDFSFVYSFLIVAMGIANLIGSVILSMALKSTSHFSTFLVVCAVATIAGTFAFFCTGKMGGANGAL